MKQKQRECVDLALFTSPDNTYIEHVLGKRHRINENVVMLKE